MDFCIEPKCSECETKKMGIEYRSVQFLIPIHETPIETGQYAKWSEWDITPKDKLPIDPQHEYSVPKSFITGLKMIVSMVQDLIVNCEKGGDGNDKNQPTI